MKIIAAAVKYGDLIFHQPKPATHPDILKAVYALNNGAGIGAEKGVLADDGTFYSLEEIPSTVSSEDLW